MCSGVWSVGFAAQWVKALFYRFCQSCPSRDGERYRGQKRTLASTDVIEVLHHSAPTFEYAMLNLANWHQTYMMSHLKLQRWMQHICVSCNQLKHVLNVSAQRNLSKPWSSWWEIGHTTRRSWGVMHKTFYHAGAAIKNSCSIDSINWHVVFIDVMILDEPLNRRRLLQKADHAVEETSNCVTMPTIVIETCPLTT